MVDTSLFSKETGQGLDFNKGESRHFYNAVL